MMPPVNVVLLHYRYAPSVAGVERVLEAHARLLADAGHSVTVLCGSGGSTDPRIRVVRLPWLVEAESSAGVSFTDRTAAAVSDLRPWLAKADCVFAHNLLTMPFHLPCTTALWQLADELPPGRIVNWIHDFAAANPDDPQAATSAEPVWARLRQRHPKMRAVAVSQSRAAQFLHWTGTPVEAVIPNGIDPAELLALPEPVARLARDARLWEAEAILLQPARLLRRKRIDFSLEVMAAVREHGKELQLLITAAPDEHRAASRAYATDVREQRSRLGLEEAVQFVWDVFPVTQRDLTGLYSISDLLWFPSREEGFGLPVVEAALHRLPVFSVNLPPMNTFPLAPENAEFFDPAASPETAAAELLTFLDRLQPWLETRRCVLRRYTWETLAPRLLRLLEPRASASFP